MDKEFDFPCHLYYIWFVVVYTVIYTVTVAIATPLVFIIYYYYFIPTKLAVS